MHLQQSYILGSKLSRRPVEPALACPAWNAHGLWYLDRPKRNHDEGVENADYCTNAARDLGIIQRNVGKRLPQIQPGTRIAVDILLEPFLFCCDNYSKQIEPADSCLTYGPGLSE